MTGARRVVIAGASGFIGEYLVRAFREEGAQVARIGRRSGGDGGPGVRGPEGKSPDARGPEGKGPDAQGSDAHWGDLAAITELIDGADLVINLAGKSVDCRYTPTNRAEIFRSRLATTRELQTAVAAASHPPRLWINASTATIYRHADDRPMTESTGEIGEGFSVNVATSWEEEFFRGELPATRRVALRMAIVLGDGSALAPIRMLAKVGLGGPQLDGRWPSTPARRAAGTFHVYRPRSRGGRQKFSWIHLRDVLGIIRFLEGHPEIEGPVNAAAPHPTDNRTFMASVRRAAGIPIGLPAWRWMLELGSAVIHTETELVLKSRWVVPERLEAAGYDFAFRDHEAALADILGPDRGRDEASTPV
ncbi:epimerase [Herbiconiux sp. YIM B11900]|uniref:epimerase n=1 Tax=Herbiconiux sp. YIM B11900 TaxID=3404131 RepID=UPI003F8693CA